MALADDERGLALGIVSFFAMIGIAALLFILFDAALEPLFTTTAEQATTTEAGDQISLALGIWDNILYYALFVAVIFIIVRAILEQRTPG